MTDAPKPWGDGEPPKLETVTYEFDELQQQFDDNPHMGLCNGCVANAKQAQKQGKPAEPIHAAVINVATPQNVNIPGVGVIPVTLALGSCFYCLGISSPIVQAHGIIPNQN